MYNIVGWRGRLLLLGRIFCSAGATFTRHLFHRHWWLIRMSAGLEARGSPGEGDYRQNHWATAQKYNTIHNRLCGRPPQMPPPPASWTLTFWHWKCCPTHVWRGLPPCQFLPAQRSKRCPCYGNVSGWLGGWMSDTRRYCIKTAKHIWKLFPPSESTIILVSSDPCADTQFQGKPLQQGH